MMSASCACWVRQSLLIAMALGVFTVGSCNRDRPRDEAWFWTLAAAGANAAAPHEKIEDALKPLSPADLVTFQTHFDRQVAKAYTWDLWGACYLIDGGCSDDAFASFRAGLIARGQQRFQSALANADSLAIARDLDFELEEVASAARKVYREKTNAHMPPTAVLHPTTPAGQPWDFEDAALVKQRFPRLEPIAKARLKTLLSKRPSTP